MEALDCVMERVSEEKARGAEMIVGISPPVEFDEMRLEVTFVRARLVEVALASVVLPVTARVPCRVEFPVVVAPPEMVSPVV